MGFLAESEIAEYLSGRFPLHQFPATLAQMFHQRTEGNPLFMVGAVDFLVAQGVIVRDNERWVLTRKLEELGVGVPDNIRQMVEKQSEQLSAPDKHLLEAASVAGGEFSAAVVASAIGEDIVATEECCKRLAQRRCFLQATGMSEWPNGTVAARYRFIHALYQNLWYEQVTAAQRLRLHQRIGECLEHAYGPRAHEIAAELARHFEQGRDFHRAVQYLGQAAENSIRRYAYREAISLATQGLELLKLLPDATERLRQELVLQTILGIALVPTHGYTAPEVGAVYARAQELCVQLGELRRLFTVLIGLWQSSTGRADHEAGHAFGKQMLALAQQEQDPVLLLQARSALGTTSFFRGELAAARECLAENTVGTDSQQPNFYIFTPWFGPEISSRAMAPLVLWHLGYPDQAREKARQTLALALALPDSFNRAITCFLTAVLYQEEGRGQAAQGKVEEMIALCTEHEFPFFVALGTVLRGWVLTQQGQAEKGIIHMRDGLVACEAVGAGIFRSHYLALLAEAYNVGGQAGQGMDVLAEALALVDETGERICEAELYRIKGELTLKLDERRP